MFLSTVNFFFQPYFWFDRTQSRTERWNANPSHQSLKNQTDLTWATVHLFDYSSVDWPYLTCERVHHTLLFECVYGLAIHCIHWISFIRCYILNYLLEFHFWYSFYIFISSQGVGLGSVMICVYCNLYYITVMAWAVLYFMTTITSSGVLPWTSCGECFFLFDYGFNLQMITRIQLLHPVFWQMIDNVDAITKRFVETGSSQARTKNISCFKMLIQLILHKTSSYQEITSLCMSIIMTILLLILNISSIRLKKLY